MTLSASAIRKRAQRAHPTMTRCERCGSTERLSRHHPDYSKPEEIVVLCSACHPQMDAADRTRRTKKPKVCAICGATFTNYSHSRVKNCSPPCAAEAGRRAAMKRWGGGTPSLLSGESPTAFPSESTDCER
jgi:protein-arginine kinase activator protein McsA